MADWFAGTRIVDLVIALAILEGLALAVHHSLTGQGLRPRDYALNLVSGLCLMLALRSLLNADGWTWQAAWLLAAGLAHWADLWRRWRHID